ncbi:MAG: phosphoenolpyruvate carboxylase [Gammaproteobacteria bacterium]|nr:phosphoenolpyruvate carboxylase [Gammaproteobacteria bacterium]NNF60821.1 phosphoenolpyruvate carboxylase [Gammaproteobacteria bacterium]
MRSGDIDFAEKDRPLREDVSLLGTLVGEMLAEQGGEALFKRVEQVRRAAIARREGTPATDDLAALVRDLNAAETLELVRAFSSYFQVVNLAERVHRIRRRRDYLRDHDDPQPRGIHEAIAQLAAAGLTLDKVEDYLGTILYEPVFTAHPTEATRRTLLEKQQLIARHLTDRFDPSRTPQEEDALLSQIRSEITSSWQTVEHPSERMTVRDERENVLFFITDVIYRIIPPFYEAVEDALVQTYGATARDVRVPLMLRFASWVGGDMDGNPNVGARTIRESLADQRHQIIARYRAEVLRLARNLSQSVERVAISDEVVDRADQYAEIFPAVAAAIHRRHGDMHYRRLLRLIAARLTATQAEESAGYDNAGEFFEDLRMVARSLRDNKGGHAGLFAMRRLLRRVETFGFHLATLDVRQDAMVHRRVIGHVLGESGWLEMDAAQRTRRIQQVMYDPMPEFDETDEVRETLAVFRTIADSQAFYGPNAIGPFIISMTQGADDVLSVMLLARWAGLADARDRISLDIAPLLETVNDLNNGPAIMRTLFADNAYKEHLRQRDSRQIIMIGYSDSNKDGGLAAARWALREGEEALVRSMRDVNVALTIFHGRGGTISRGGGKVHRAVLAAPRGSVNGRLRVTEQGEVINAKFGLRGIALRVLEQAASATALATYVDPPEPTSSLAAPAVMQQVATVAREAYRGLVYEDARLVEYFRQATPIDVIERMQIGSRPASRRSGKGIENLRAIPWVFAWSQSRLVLPGWYGVGHGLAAAEAEYGIGRLRDLQRDWPFFTNIVNDVEMVLAKGDMDIAASYAQLADEPLQPLYDEIRSEFDRTCEMILRIKESDALLDDDPALQRSIRLRNPYTDPISLLQVDLLQRWRAADRDHEALLDALFASVRGISQALQNTG